MRCVDDMMYNADMLNEPMTFKQICDKCEIGRYDKAMKNRVYRALRQDVLRDKVVRLVTRHDNALYVSGDLFGDKVAGRGDLSGLAGDMNAGMIAWLTGCSVESTEKMLRECADEVWKVKEWRDVIWKIKG